MKNKAKISMYKAKVHDLESEIKAKVQELKAYEDA